MIKQALFIATILAVLCPLAVFAQGPAAPSDLKAERLNANTIRLTWTPPSGTGYKFLVERGGPGLTLYTQIAGPISEPRYDVDLKANGMDADANYTYRVRALDSSSTKGPYSRAVSAPAVMKNLPLVGTNVLDLIATLSASRPPVQISNCPIAEPSAEQVSCRLLPMLVSEPMNFILTAVSGRMLTFQDADGSFSRECSDCEFSVPATRRDPSITFKLSADGAQLLVTCRAPVCEVLTARAMDVTDGILHASGDIARRRLTTDESIRIPASQRTLFSIFAK